MTTSCDLLTKEDRYRKPDTGIQTANSNR